jgi:hypothetical protein
MEQPIMEQQTQNESNEEASAQQWRVPQELRFPNLPPVLPAKETWELDTTVQMFGVKKSRSEQLRAIDNCLAEYGSNYRRCVTGMQDYYRSVNMYLTSTKSEVTHDALDRSRESASQDYKRTVQSFRETTNLFESWRREGHGNRGAAVGELAGRLSSGRHEIDHMEQALEMGNNGIANRITTIDATRVLRNARAFYKGGQKSLNKMYLDPDTPKKELRNDNAVNSVDDMAELPRKIMENQRTLATSGEYLVSNNITYGNCDEMAQVSIYFALADPKMSPKMQHLRLASADWGAANHGFMLVSDGPKLPQEGGERPFGIKDQFRSPDNSGVWVVDTWMNIACRAEHYEERVREKCTQWQEQGKVMSMGAVLDESGGGERILPKNIVSWQSFIDGLVNTPLDFENVPMERPRKRFGRSTPLPGPSAGAGHRAGLSPTQPEHSGSSRTPSRKR